MKSFRKTARDRHNTAILRAAFAVVFGTLILPIVWAAPPAFAHAKLLSSTPAQAEHLDTLPANIVLEFTERVGLEFSTIELYDGEGRELGAGKLARSGSRETTIALPMGDQSATGVVYVVWRVVSSVDGHLTTGSYWFTVGEGVGNLDPNSIDFPAPPSGDDTAYEGAASGLDISRLLARFLVFASSALLLGGPVFALLVTEQSTVQYGQTGARIEQLAQTRLAAIGAVAASVVALGLLVDLLAQTALVAGTDYAGALGRLDMTQLLLSSTRFGLAWILKLLAALLLASLMLFALAAGNRKLSNIWEVVIAAASLLLLAEALSSHAAAAQGGSIGGLPVPVISDWLHLVTASLWAGGLLYMMTILFPVMKSTGMSSSDRNSFLKLAIPRFSRLAIASVVILALTGSYNLLVHTTDIRALFESSYGWVLALKVILFMALVSLGALNVRLFRPRATGSINEPNENAARGLVRNVRVEVPLALVVLACAGALTLLPPPSADSQAPGESSESTTRTLATARSSVSDYSVTLKVMRSPAGEFFRAEVFNADESAVPLSDVSKALFRITPQDGPVVSSSVESQSLSSAQGDTLSWQGPASSTAAAGDYFVAVIIQRQTADDIKAGFRLERGDTGSVVITPWRYLEAHVDTVPSPPQPGENILQVRVVDGSGVPVTGAMVTARLEHPATGMTTQETVLASDSQGDGTFTAKVTLQERGAWRVILSVSLPDEPDIFLDASMEVGQ